MNRKYYLFIITLFVIIIGGFILSIGVANATTTTVIRECNNGPSRTNSGGCGIACARLCEDKTFYLSESGQSLCRGRITGTNLWTKYRGTMRRIQVSEEECRLRFPRVDHGECFDWEMSFIEIDDVCSLADKCRGSECDSPRSPFLRSGSCECGPGEVGGVYKICCLRGPGGTYTPTDAREYHEQDRFLPQEGHCRGANVRTAWSQASEDAHPGLSGHLVVQGSGTGLTCVPIGAEEVEPTISLSANPIRINVGESTTLSWTTTGLTTPCNITRVGPGERGGINNVQPNGSATSDPRTTGIHTYTLTCAVTNRPTETRTSLPVTVTVASVTEVPVAQRWWFCANNACRQTTGQFTTAADCQAAVLQHWRINTTCHRTEDECRPGCGVSPVPTPITPAPTPIISTHNDIHFNFFRANPTCIPQQPGSRREVSLEWNVSIENSCPTEPNDAHTFVPGSNDSNCGGGQGSWTSGWRLTSPSSYTASCIAFGGWSGDKNLRGTESIPPPSFTTTYGLNCSRTDDYTCRYSRIYTYENWECVQRTQYSYDCDETITDPVTGVTTIISRTCWGSRCDREDCVSRSGSVSGSGPTFGPSSSSRETTLAVVQPLNSVILESEKDRILHKTSTDISWSSSAPSSGVSTNIRCTPSVQANGDGTNWTGAINSLDSSGTRRISPRRTTTYELLCRNIYQNDQACYTYRSATQLIRVFDPDLREVPAFYDGFMRLVGRIGNALR